MKKNVLMTVVLLLAGLTASAQMQDGEHPIGEVKNGVWEAKQVVAAEGVSASALYLRALEALSDWAGSQEHSKIGIDVQDKEEGIVVYKGEYYLGYGKANFMYGWDTWANFTMKIRCKEGRAQVSVAVPSLIFRFTGDPAETTAPIDQLLPEYKYKTKYTNKRAAKELSPQVPSIFAGVIKMMCERLAKGRDDDDF